MEFWAKFAVLIILSSQVISIECQYSVPQRRSETGSSYRNRKANGYQRQNVEQSRNGFADGTAGSEGERDDLVGDQPLRDSANEFELLPERQNIRNAGYSSATSQEQADTSDPSEVEEIQKFKPSKSSYNTGYNYARKNAKYGTKTGNKRLGAAKKEQIDEQEALSDEDFGSEQRSRSYGQEQPAQIRDQQTPEDYSEALRNDFGHYDGRDEIRSSRLSSDGFGQQMEAVEQELSQENRDRNDQQRNGSPKEFSLTNNLRQTTRPSRKYFGQKRYLNEQRSVYGQEYQKKPKQQFQQQTRTASNGQRFNLRNINYQLPQENLKGFVQTQDTRHQSNVMPGQTQSLSLRLIDAENTPTQQQKSEFSPSFDSFARDEPTENNFGDEKVALQRPDEDFNSFSARQIKISNGNHQSQKRPNGQSQRPRGFMRNTETVEQQPMQQQQQQQMQQRQRKRPTFVSGY